jgi:hypothetical protein
MRGGLSTMLGTVRVYQTASRAAVAFMEQHYGDDEVLGPYLAALEGFEGAAKSSSERLLAG